MGDIRCAKENVGVRISMVIKGEKLIKLGLIICSWFWKVTTFEVAHILHMHP